MLLREYLRALPFGVRSHFREQMAQEHGVSVSLVRKWENDPAPHDWPQEKRRAQSRKHPAALAAIEITERLTKNQVTRYDLRPECWAKADDSEKEVGNG